MNLTPADLGSPFEKILLERRGARSDSTSSERFRKAGWVMAALVPFELGIALYAHDPGFIVGPGLLTAMALIVPRTLQMRQRRLREKPLRENEIEGLRPRRELTLATAVPPPVAFLASLLGRPLPMPKVGDGLEDAFFSLALQILRLEVSEESVASELKRTLKALGDAVGDLPAPAELPEIDIADLVADAEVLLIRARREKDEVVAGSLQRQAEATVRRARATADALKLARRTRTLRQEVLAQVESCRVALPGLARTSGASSSLGIGRFTSLAEQVQGVAREAASVAAAQEELAQAVGTYAMSAPEAQTLRLGR